MAVLETPLTSAGLEEAVNALNQGQLVVLPTETVYGVFAVASNKEAVARLREFKGMNASQSLVWHTTRDRAKEVLSKVGPIRAKMLAGKAMPGPLTLMLELDESDKQWVLQAMGLASGSHDEPIDGGPDSLHNVLFDGRLFGIRVPKHEATQAILEQIEQPVVATSVHRSADQLPASDAQQASLMVGDASALIVDGGMTKHGRGSTVVRYSGKNTDKTLYRIEREGLYDARMVEQMSQREIVFVCSGNTCRSPMAELLAKSSLAKHYGIPLHELEQQGWTVRSAGVFAATGMPATREAVQVMSLRGLDLSLHQSQPAHRDLLNRADHIYTMTRGHQEALWEMAPSLADKVERLIPDQDIIDPIGSDASVYDQTADMIQQAIHKRMESTWV